jgi:hypothetical protein
MQREIKVGSISWIDEDPNPVWTSAQAGLLEPAWVAKTYLGLAATKNDAPPKSLPDFKGYQAKKDFRSLTYCKFYLDIDDATGTINEFRVLDAVHDGGWTPFFKLRHWPLSIMSIDKDILFNWKPAQGEASSLSLVNTQARHKCTTIKGVSPAETVLVNALIKFRAGSHTDDVGVDVVGCPFHVPWVWCETLLTFASGKLKLYGVGSLFPSHAWYLDDNQVKTTQQLADDTFPLSWTKTIALNPSLQMIPDPLYVTVPTGPTIVLSALKIYPILSAGAPASSSSKQAPLADEAGRTGPVDAHRYTVTAGTMVTWP